MYESGQSQTAVVEAQETFAIHYTLNKFITVRCLGLLPTDSLKSTASNTHKTVTALNTGRITIHHHRRPCIVIESFTHNIHQRQTDTERESCLTLYAVHNNMQCLLYKTIEITCLSHRLLPLSKCNKIAPSDSHTKSYIAIHSLFVSWAEEVRYSDKYIIALKLCMIDCIYLRR